VWSDTPKDLTQPFEWSADATKFTMTTPPYTSIALANPANDEIITAQITGYKYNADVSFVIGDSACLIEDDSYKTYAANNNGIKIIIKAPNYLPAEFTYTSIVNPIANKIHQFSVIPVKGKVFVNFTLPVDEHVNVSVYNSKGVLVKTLFNKINTIASSQQMKLDNNDLSNGVYYCKLRTKNAQGVESFVITK
jgi:hypothetical protein